MKNLLIIILSMHNVLSWELCLVVQPISGLALSHSPFLRDTRIKTQKPKALVLRATSYLREIADQMAAMVICFSHDVEQKGLYVIVEGFVVQEKLCE